MNKKFFAALASATMAFTASGSIAVFADDFVEENTPVVDGDVTPLPETVVWNEDNFGALVKEAGSVFQDTSSNSLTNADQEELEEGDKVKTADLANVTKITLTAATDGEIKGLEYFTGLTSFTAKAGKLTNKTLDFSANTKLETLKVEKAQDLTELVFPKADEEEEFHLATLELLNTKMTSLDLSGQPKLVDVTANKNYNLKEVVVRKGTTYDKAKFKKLNLKENALETVNLDYIEITDDTPSNAELDLSGNHIGALDLSKTTVNTSATKELGNQKFYVSENFGTVNLVETFENFDVEKVTNPSEKDDFNKETGALTLSEDETTYTYEVSLANGTADMTVKLIKANPMYRLYNPNSGEHFYTADLEEKEALVKLGWNDEGYGWVAAKTPDSDLETNAVYRLYNPNAGDHHYTMEKDERDTLVAYGWKYETIGWYSATGDTVTVYRQYNPYANGAGAHNYTTDKAENDYLVSLGWIYEGAAWSALR